MADITLEERVAYLESLLAARSIEPEDTTTIDELDPVASVYNEDLILVKQNGDEKKATVQNVKDNVMTDVDTKLDNYSTTEEMNEAIEASSPKVSKKPGNVVEMETDGLFVSEDISGKVESFTQEAYDELPEEEKNDGKIREITDAEGFPVPFAIMNDEMTTSANVLSAQEIENRIVAKVTEHPYIMRTLEYGTKWYRLYSDGWCEQGDYGTIAGSGSPVQVTFLIPFKTINYSLSIALNENISTSPYWNDFGYDRTENGFKLRTTNKNSWIASGFVDLNNIPEIN